MFDRTIKQTVKQLRDIWHMPHTLAEACDRIRELERDKEDLVSRCEDLERESGETAELAKDMITERDLEALGGQLEDLQEGVGKLDSRIEDLENAVDPDMINISHLFDLLQGETNRRLNALARAEGRPNG